MLPAFSLAAQFEAVGQDGDAAGHAARQLVDVHIPLRIDPDDDVVAFGDDRFQAQSLASQLDPQRVRKIVQLGRARAIAILELAQDRFQLLLVLGSRQLAVRPEAKLLVADV